MKSESDYFSLSNVCPHLTIAVASCTLVTIKAIISVLAHIAQIAPGPFGTRQAHHIHSLRLVVVNLGARSPIRTRTLLAVDGRARQRVAIVTVPTHLTVLAHRVVDAVTLTICRIAGDRMVIARTWDAAAKRVSSCDHRWEIAIEKKSIFK